MCYTNTLNLPLCPYAVWLIGLLLVCVLWQITKTISETGSKRISRHVYLKADTTKKTKNQYRETPSLGPETFNHTSLWKIIEVTIGWLTCVMLMSKHKGEGKDNYPGFRVLVVEWWRNSNARAFGNPSSLFSLLVSMSVNDTYANWESNSLWQPTIHACAWINSHTCIYNQISGGYNLKTYIHHQPKRNKEFLQPLIVVLLCNHLSWMGHDFPSLYNQFIHTPIPIRPG